MHKKQMAALVAILVTACSTANPEWDETEEGEARTLLALGLRKAAPGLIATATGCTEEQGKTAYDLAKTQHEEAAADKKDMKAD